ncbi:MAG: prepilin-type N-terminal cleavage/methylation domain-containing protein [Candidatus Sungbacteria bacterium]|uniref:Prepilin-type N-terminal cleavage/methylation domain-containing protein n=1 Tax=Candidatus Sungiibacteriota bacterium TaxID=2750080 RepID=A0A9D6QVH1_9BACT|nr:prepilin-type N-terminal cleavage/methylation domain-containing protein [Candidatus Sungbacteria bacterium]
MSNPEYTNTPKYTNIRIKNVFIYFAKIWIFASSRGFTLLETVVALAVILSAIVGPFVLASRGIVSIQSTKNDLIGMNLAQEGVELVRKIRDDNILNARAWNQNIPTGGPWRIDIATNTLEAGSSLLYFYPDYSLYAAPGRGLGATGEILSLFSRTVQITTPYATPGITTDADAILVVSTVTWSEHGINRSVVLQEVLYNWQ